MHHSISVPFEPSPPCVMTHPVTYERHLLHHFSKVGPKNCETNFGNEVIQRLRPLLKSPCLWPSLTRYHCVLAELLHEINSILKLYDMQILQFQDLLELASFMNFG